VETTTLRCACGYIILCRVRGAGERVGFLAFFDGEPTSETYGQQIERCPRCGTQLGLPELYRINRPG
jgi:DNA-directed RNA polymerase subunit RPC12/RpoP